ncbi:MAG: phage portal protein, partial [Nitrosarchaeum sp.]
GETNDKSYTGKTVDEENAMTNTAVWSAVTQLSQIIASLPLNLYMRQSDGNKKIAINHRNYDLLHISPNPFMSSMAYRECQMGQILRYGTCYSEKELDGNGNVIALWPLLSAKVRPDVLLNDIVYVVTLPNGKENVLDKSRILRVNGFSSNGLIGYSPVEFCKESIALSLAIEEYGARFYGNGARPAAVLEHPQELSQPAQDRLRENWDKIHKGLENSHRIAILEEGMKLHEFTVTPEDSQTLETRKFQVEEVARIFNLPVHMLKNLDRCLPADVLVYTKNGPKKIVDVEEGDLVWSYGSGKFEFKRVIGCYNNGKSDILKISTTNRIIRCNANHRILVRRKKLIPLLPGQIGGHNFNGKKYRIKWENKYIPAGKLKIGDTVIVLDNLPDRGVDFAPNGRKLTQSFMEFCGLLLGDGNIQYHNGDPKGITIARADHANYMEYYRSVIHKEFKNYKLGGKDIRGNETKKIKLTEGIRKTQFSSVLAADELYELDFDGNAFTK